MLSDGRVLISAGTDGQGQPVLGSEIFDPGAQSFVVSQTPSQTVPVTFSGSVPEPRAVDAPVDTTIALRYSGPLDVKNLDNEVLLSGPDGPHAIIVVPAEDGRLVFVTPASPLLAGTVYGLTLHNLIDTSGLAVPPVTIEFTTRRGGDGAAERPSTTAVPDPGTVDTTPRTGSGEEEWIPSESNFSGKWVSVGFQKVGTLPA